MVGQLMLECKDTLNGWVAMLFASLIFVVLAFDLVIFSAKIYGRSLKMQIINILVSILFVYNLNIIAKDLYAILVQESFLL